MRVRAVSSFLLLVLVAAAIPCAYSQSSQAGGVAAEPAVGSLEQIVSNMEQAQLRNRENLKAYTVTREYKLFDDETKAQVADQKPTSEVRASVEFVPPNHKTFRIDSTEGSDRGKNIVQHILENESGNSGKPPAALTRENYDFKLLGEDAMNGQSCWVLEITPKRDDRTRIRGKAWVDKNTYLVQQVQGEMSKTPSWWLKKVNTTVRFGNADGMWLPMASYSIADVRVFGKHVLTSQAVEIKTTDQVARTSTHTERHQFRSYAPMIGTGIYVRR